MNKDIPLIIIGLIFIYIVLSVSKENFNTNKNPYQDLPHRKLDLTIEPMFLKGHLPIGSENTEIVQISKCETSKAVTIPKATGLITKYRENVDKYIKESMLLNKPNHNLGFQPSNVRYMDLMYNKPTQIGAIPLFKMNIPDKIKMPKITQASEEEDIVSEEY